jgi:F-type H+-transporting ATPase subunit delta
MPQDRHVDLYAEALLCLAQAEDQLSLTEEQLLGFLDVVKSRPQLRAFLSDPAVADEGKHSALKEILDGRVSDSLRYFILLLRARGAISDLPAIADVFFQKASEQRRRAAGLLISARPLEEETVRRVEEAVGAALGKEVHLLVQVAPSLLGGMRVEVGDFVVDGTLDRRLDDARRALVQHAV